MFHVSAQVYWLTSGNFACCMVRVEKKKTILFIQLSGGFLSEMSENGFVEHHKCFGTNCLLNS